MQYSFKTDKEKEDGDWENPERLPREVEFLSLGREIVTNSHLEFPIPVP